jgi:ribosomal protein S14
MNHDRRTAFLSAVLGSDGSSALNKAAERSPELGAALWPRTILAWLNTVREDFEGELPGVENTYVQFSKNENGYSGSIAIGEEVYKLEKASVFEMLASVAVALDLDQQPSGDLRDIDLEKLGRSVDLLAKARMVADELAKGEGKKCEICDKQIDFWNPKVGPKKEARFCSKCGDEADKKIEALEKKGMAPSSGGVPAAPTPPEAPIPPTPKAPPPPSPSPPPPKPRTPKAAKPVASHTLKLSEKEASTPCSLCGMAQFTGVKFTGCQCFRDIAKSVETSVDASKNIVVKLGEEWDQDAVVTLLEAIGRR